MVKSHADAVITFASDYTMLRIKILRIFLELNFKTVKTQIIL